MENLSLLHLLYGNIYADVGQKLIAASEQADVWQSMAVSSFNLGDIDMQGQRWRNYPRFTGQGLFWSRLKDQSFIFSLAHLQKTTQGDARGSYLYHWVLLSLEDILAIGGLWSPVFAQLEDETTRFLSQNPRPAIPFHHVSDFQLSLNSQQRAIQHKQNISKLFQWFSNGEQIQLLGVILDRVLANRLVTIEGLPFERRVELIEAISAAFPPSLRCFVSFASRVVQSNYTKTLIKFLDNDQPVFDPASEYLLRWRNGRFEGRALSYENHSVNWLIDSLKQGPERLHGVWEESDSFAAALIRRTSSPVDVLRMLSIRHNLMSRWSTRQKQTIDVPLHEDFLKAIESTGAFEPETSEWLVNLTQDYLESGQENRQLALALRKSLDLRHDAIVEVKRNLIEKGLSTNTLRLLRIWVEAEADIGWASTLVWDIVFEGAFDASTSYDLLKLISDGTLHGSVEQLRYFARQQLKLLEEQKNPNSEQVTILIRVLFRHLAPQEILQLLQASNTLIELVPRPLQDILRGSSEPFLLDTATIFPEPERNVALIKLSLISASQGMTRNFNHGETMWRLVMIAGLQGEPVNLDLHMNETFTTSAALANAAASLLNKFSQQDSLWDVLPSYPLLYWNLYQFSLSQKGTHDQVIGIIRSLLQKEAAQQILENLYNMETGAPTLASVSLVALCYVEMSKMLVGEERVQISIELLSLLPQERWYTALQAIRIIIESLGMNHTQTNTSVQSMINRNFHSRILEWFLATRGDQKAFAQEERHALLLQLLDWWSAQIYHASQVNLDEGFKWILNAVELVEPQRGYHEIFCDALRSQITKMDSLTLEALLEKARRAHLAWEIEEINLALLVRRFVPDGDLNRFYARAREAFSFLLQMYQVQLELEKEDTSKDRVDNLAVHLGPFVSAQLTSKSRTEFAKLLQDYSALLNTISQRAEKKGRFLGIGQQPKNKDVLSILSDFASVLDDSERH